MHTGILLEVTLKAANSYVLRFTTQAQPSYVELSRPIVYSTALQELIAARGRRLQQSEQRLLDALYPTAEHVKTRQHEIFTLQEKAKAAQTEARYV